MSKQFPNPCCRCGFCCYVTPCSVAREVYGIGPKSDEEVYPNPCPGLRFEKRLVSLMHPERDIAFCEIIETHPLYSKEDMGVGYGCCISAQIPFMGREIEFSSLPDEAKHDLCKKMRESNIKIIKRKKAR